MTYNEIAYDILEILKGNQISDDVDISLEHILYHLNQQRALWIRREYNKPGRHIDQHLIQDLGCVELELIDAADCCDITTDCYVLRTKKVIPAFLELHSGSAVTRVGSINKTSKPYSFTSLARASVAFYSKYGKNQVYAFLLNDYMHIISQNPKIKLMDHINIRGVIANPTDIIDFKCDITGNACFSYENEYPINNWMLPLMKEQIINQFGVSLSIPKDNDNNAKNNISKN